MKRLLFILTLFALQGCIKPFDYDVDEGPKILVVNGLITNEPGPYTVKINKTTSYGGYFSDVHADVRDADVTITDDLGNAEKLTQIQYGEFRTKANGIQGRHGGKYTLHIRLKNGQEYISETETLSSVSEIDRMYLAYKETVSVDANKNEKKVPYFEIQIDTKDPGTERNFYRWISVGTYEVETQPENYKTQDKHGNLIPAPKDCCRQCWAVRIDYSATVTSDKLFNGNSLVGQPISNLPITPQYLSIKYHLELKQYAISEKAFYFWKTIQNQATGSGSIQDPAPANAPGNIRNVHNPDEQVLGFFGASGVTVKKMYITRADVPFRVPTFEYPDDCRTIPTATTTKPSFWQ